MKLPAFLISLVLSGAIFASTTNQVQVIKPYSNTVSQQTLSAWFASSVAKQSNFSERLTSASALFLGRPYQLFPNGEGPKGAIDQAPLYRTDTFDCTTYVVTAIALAQSHDLASFENRYEALMYKQSNVDFFARNHFATIDFNKNNEATGTLSNITQDIKGKQGQTLTKVLTNTIDKPSWYQHMGLSRVRLLVQPSPIKLNQIRELLKHEQSVAKSKTVSVDYIPLSNLINSYGEANLYILKQIPNGSLMEVVYEDPNEITKIGTNLQVSHMGFVFSTPKGPVFREASSLANKVIDVPLKDYLRTMQQDPDVLGIHLESIH